MDTFKILKKNQVDQNLIKSFKKEFIRKHRFIPFQECGNVLSIAVYYKNLELENDLKQMFPEKEIKYHFYNKENIEQLLRDFIDGEVIVKSLNQLNNSVSIDDKTVVTLDSFNNDAAARQFIAQMIKEAIFLGASDIHINPTEKNINILFRIDGILSLYKTIGKNALGSLLTIIKIDGKLDISEKRKPQDGSFTISNGNKRYNLRIATINTVYGEKCTLRILDDKAYAAGLSQIGFSFENLEKFKNLIHKPYGVILMTGPTGSGKSTTLYAAIKELNNGKRSIVTIEDPCEYHIDGIVQTEVNPKIELGFSTGLRSILRHDPDILLIGEIRDLETAEIAMRSAGTGHLVLTTLHANNAISSIAQLSDMGVAHYIIGATLSGIINQRLIRTICPHCKQKKILEPNAIERKFFNISNEQTIVYYESRGCELCNYTGYKGRTLIQEIIVIDSELSRLICSGQNINEHLDILQKQNFKSIKEDGLLKILDGQTDFKEVIRHVI